jgi:hypothetical protein
MKVRRIAANSAKLPELVIVIKSVSGDRLADKPRSEHG